MSENNRNNRRKSKLVPRECIEDLEWKRARMENPDGEILEPDPPLSLLPRIKTEIDKNVKLLPEKPAPPIQFSINVEVEEFDEDICSTEDPHFSHVNESNSNDAHTNLTDDSHYDLGSFNDKALKQCVISEEEIHREIEELAKITTSKADKQLEVAIWNARGRVLTPLQENPENTVIQNVLEKWRIWNAMSKIRDTVLTYKCYICDIGWWHLDPFREHIKQHQNVTLSIEPLHHECSIVAFFGTEHGVKDIPIEGNCWRCLKSYLDHVKARRNSSMFYFCPACIDKSFTCTGLAEHEGKCQRYQKLFLTDVIRCENDFKCQLCNIICLTQERYNIHMSTRHTVRSDLPIMFIMKVCNYCNSKYAVHSTHECPHKPYNFQCKYCFRRFQSKHFALLHEMFTKSDYYCLVCNKHLRKQCMEMEHIVRHSMNYVLAYKCITCVDNLLFPNESSVKQHRLIWHGKKFDKRRACYDTVVIPKKCMIYTIQELDIVATVHGKFVVNQSEEIQVPSVVPILKKIKKTPQKQPKNVEDESEETKNVILVADIDSQESQREIEEAEREIEESKNFITKLLQESLNAECSNIKELDNDFHNIVVKTEIEEIKTEKEDYFEYDQFEEVENYEEVKSHEAHMETHEPQMEHENQIKKDEFKTHDEIDIKQEVMDYEETLSSVFQASQNITATDVSDQFSSLIKDEFIIKEEPMEEEEFEDDIIILNTDITVDTKRNSETTETDASKREPSTEPSSSGVDIMNFEPDITISNRNRKIYNCNKCNYSGYHRDYRVHVQSVCPRKRQNKTRPKTGKDIWDEYGCTKCNRTYSNMRKYIKHLVKHDLTYAACPQCNVVFENIMLTIPHLILHVKQSFMKIHLLLEEQNCISSVRDGLFQCKTCTENVTFKDYFRHWESHLKLQGAKKERIDSTEDEKHVGNLERALSPEMLRIALENLTKSQRKMDKTCAVCDRKFNRRNDCKRHIVEHLLQDAFAYKYRYNALRCQQCREDFQKMDQYKEHMRLHASLPLYKCELCNRAFSDSSNFGKHKKVHNLKVLVCDICKKKFQAKRSLEKHMEFHQTTKPTKCSHCDRSFFTLTQCNKHVKMVHDKKTSYFACRTCGTRYRCLKDKWDHMWEVHKERKHDADCPFCDRSFRKFHDVKQHVKQDHNIRLVRKQEYETLFVYE